ncbi:hypothetical protein I4Q36_01600 [Tuanshanicoccus lijuaniae]|uniref:ornithine cyclodeaminase family domain n=1 Tax=Aerococcaceae bacterium zg-1292 TaxID=2774330 RepID=UPI0019371B20|nr:hypothetical protein [Aerococcaceae bacterium zg-1292]MBF6625138.1 hypothetical protein [Aerococcaceae bacterium zg-BR9]MBF6978266.1 hypothetical protein [Aerococcaceae bacterium zg-BR22]MBS4456481.1 hypothetical protein [Aerococcaceae bacterium zg-A91]MBS4458331.1 hypothetical protein [Aerococcaceae bacterium zg-BR33]
MLKYYQYSRPEFTEDVFTNAPDVKVGEVTKDGVVPTGFFLTTHRPTYYKVKGEWLLPTRSSLNCVAVVGDGEVVIKEIRDVKVGDKIVLARSNDAAEGVFVHTDGFSDEVIQSGGDFVEASNSTNYKMMYELLKHEKENNGYIVWVLGPAVVFDHNTRRGLSKLAENGYVHSLLGGNAMATHDLEGGYLGTALGQDIYTQISEPLGHYNHLDLLNAIRRTGSIKEFIDQGNVKDGFVKTLVKLGVPITLAGSIRDDGPLPEVTAHVYDSLTNAREELTKATLVVCLATTLHSASSAEISSSYRVDDEGNVLPVFFYTVDVTENAVRKVSAARENVAVRTLVTNVQDFVVNLEYEMVGHESEFEDEQEVEAVEYVEVKAEAEQEDALAEEIE